jgi:transposase
MAFLGEVLNDQVDATPFAPRCTKDLIEERLFGQHRSLFTGLDLVFFDTTSIYFEGKGGETLGRFGHSKDHRPDRKQMVVGAILDDNGRPICCEMWPGNTADVKSLLPVVERLRSRFNIKRFCIVADRGMISADTITTLESADCDIPYILGARMRRVKEVSEEVLARAGRYHEVHPEGTNSKAPAALAVKEIFVEGRRYIVCRNSKQERKDRAARQAMLTALEERIKNNPKGLVGNRGYARYIKVSKGAMTIDRDKIDKEARFDGKWVLRTNMNLSAERVALKYKELWQVEQVFRDVKSVLDTRPVFHKRDETIRGHVFCSFLALVLRKELDRRLESAGHQFEWAEIKRDLRALQDVLIEDNGRSLSVRTACTGSCGKVFQAVGVALPPTVRET